MKVVVPLALTLVDYKIMSDNLVTESCIKINLFNVVTFKNFAKVCFSTVKTEFIQKELLDETKKKIFRKT